MKKSLMIYGLISLSAFIATVLIMSTVGTAEKEDKKESVEVKKEPVRTTLPASTTPVATYVEDATSQQVPDPCQTVSIENINKYVPNSVVRGPQFQSAIAPIKGCEWANEVNKDIKLAVTIILSPSAIDSAEATKVKDVVVGEKAFIAANFSTGFGGSACGQTVYVKLRAFSYYVAYCGADNAQENEKILIELANGVANSLP